jgi:hypothetical protein
VNFRAFPNLGFLWYYFDITDERQGRALTYDELYNPGAPGSVNPFGEFTGLLVRVPGSEDDSTWKKRFTSDQQTFAPNQTIDQTFKLIVDYTMNKVNADYKVSSVVAEGMDQDIVRLSTRTLAKGAPRPDNLASLRPDQTRPTFMGSLGETTYDITFGEPVDMVDVEFDTVTKSDITVTEIRDDEGNVFRPRPLPIRITSRAHCDAELTLIRDGRTTDVERTDNPDYYTSVQEQAPNFFPTYNDPDTMLTPIAGHFAVDAWHYTYGDGAIPSDALKIDNPRGTTTGNFYYPNEPRLTVGGKTLATVHRIRVAGAEIILNAPGISNIADIGDETPQRDQGTSDDIKPGDKISITFTGLARNMPFPDTAFVIETSKSPIDFANPNLYLDTVLEQVQVVPNPYIVTHSGQTSTDNAKLYFTRLPPRATIEIYNIAGDLIKTLEHNAYLTGDGGQVTGLAGNASMLEWNLLSEGRQRIGSQVLTARVIAKDASGSVTGEVIKKFAVVVGGYRIVR